MGELKWARWPGKRCTARLEPKKTSAYFGRCDLEPHPDSVDHALERGMDTVRFRTSITRLSVS